MIDHPNRVRSLSLAAIVGCVLLLTGCAGIAYDAARGKEDAIQLPLTALPDGAQFDWSSGTEAGGEIRIESTYSKGATVCRIVSERERVAERHSRLIATYCLTPEGEWR